MSGRFAIHATPFAGLFVVERRPHTDERGYFERVYCAEELKSAGLDKPIRQINRTLTRTKGTIRGLHFQYPPHMEIKVVSCVAGAVFDVAVDLRKGSPTFLRWHGELLSADNRRTLVIPEGFAHGFQTLEGECEMLYLHTADYAANAEGGFNANDARLAIGWPLASAHRSERDAGLPSIPLGWEGIAA